MSKKWWALTLLASLSFVLGYGVVANAFPSYNDKKGYFKGRENASSDAVWSVLSTKAGCEGDGSKYAIPGWVVGDNNNDNVEDQGGVSNVELAYRFVAFVKCKLQNTANTYVGHQDRVGAAFIIATMTNTNLGNYLNYAPDDATFNKFANLVIGAANAGWVNFRASLDCDEFTGTWTTHNTYFQTAYQDDIASYYGCGSSANRSIVFTNGSADESQWYVIKRTCANPIGAMKPLRTDWAVTGDSSITNSTNPARGANPYPGDRIVFHHNLRNNTNFPTTLSIGVYAAVFRQASLTATEDGPLLAGAAPFGNIQAHSSVTDIFSGDADLTVDIPEDAQAGTTYCQRVGWDPVNSAGARDGRGATVCATVQAPQPPVNFDISGVSRVNGGTTDISVGVGGSAQFTHQLSNSGAAGMTATNVSINWQVQYANSKSAATWTNATYGGSSGSIPAGLSAGGSSAANLGQHSENTTADLLPGQTRCYRIAWTPDTQSDSSTHYSTPVCVTVTDFLPQPAIVPVINETDAAPNADVFVEPGDSVSFRYEVWNSGQTATPQVNCRYGSSAVSSYDDTAPGLAPSAEAGLTLLTNPVCSYNTSTTFPVRVSATQPSVTPTAQQTSAITAEPNMSYCRAMQAVWDGSNSATVRSCVFVVSKPVFQVRGGDIAVGGGVQTTAGGSCSSNPGASIVGWNRRDLGDTGWHGAGVQYAAYAMDQIFDFATKQSQSSSSASEWTPTGLSFANTGTETSVNTTNGVFGGQFGSSPCIPDYFANHPATADLSGNISSAAASGLATGDHYWGAGTTVQLGDTPPAGSGDIAISNRVTLYINGDLYITKNIVYAGNNWSVDSMPMFKVVVRGNIYIDKSVSRLDGLYFAQPAGADTKGIIYTCALSAAPYTDMAAVYNDCSGNTLTVNGSFAAREIQLLRTGGESLRNVSDGSSVAEKFNFNPMLWIAQPPVTNSSAAPYDAIASLPPVL